MIILILFFLGFEFFAFISFQFVSAKSLSACTAIFITILDGWLNYFVLWIIWHIVGGPQVNYDTVWGLIV